MGDGWFGEVNSYDHRAERNEMGLSISDKIKREISKYARIYEVDKIVLFGSRARNTHSERSDIDIAVYGGSFDEFYWDVKENIHSLLMLDMVNMDGDVSDDLKMEIERDGVLIYEKDR